MFFMKYPTAVLLFLPLLALVHPVSSIQGTMVLDLGPTSWDKSQLFRPWVTFDGSSFAMWYGGEDSSGTDRIGFATSKDGIAWTKYSGNPILQGSVGWEADSITDACVIYDNGQYKMWYTGQKYGATASQDIWQIGLATSPDGIHWTKYSGNPVLTPGSLGSWDDRRVWRPTVISTGSGYVMYYRGASVIEGSQAKAGVATSSDGIRWTKTVVLNMPQGSSGWDSYSRQVSALNIGGVMKSSDEYVMSYSSIKTQSSPAEIGLADSHDGINWMPYQDNPVVTYGSTGWDGGPGGVGAGNFAGSMPLAAQDKYYIYYAAQDAQGTYRIGLAILPLIFGSTSSTSQSQTHSESITSSTEALPITTTEHTSENAPAIAISPTYVLGAVILGTPICVLYVLNRRRKKTKEEKTRVY